MRIIHTRKRTFEQDFGFSKKLNLLTWILSIIKWKEYDNQIILYADTKTLEDIKKFGFDSLYDEINTTYLEDEDVCTGIDFYCYWAMPKLLALKYETLELGNDVVIADQDVVPMSDVSRMWTNSDIAIWNNKEFVEIRSVYPRLTKLSLPQNYKLPEWFTGKAQPLNTGILHIKSKDVIKLFTDEALAMSKDNHNEHENTNCQTMCNVEQRLLGEVVEHKELTYSVMQPVNEGLFNRNGFHIHGYKNIINNENGLDWHCSLLRMIQKSNKDMYNVLIENPFFKEEKEALENNTYTFVKQLRQYL